MYNAPIPTPSKNFRVWGSEQVPEVSESDVLIELSEEEQWILSVPSKELREICYQAHRDDFLDVALPAATSDRQVFLNVLRRELQEMALTSVYQWSISQQRFYKWYAIRYGQDDVFAPLLNDWRSVLLSPALSDSIIDIQNQISTNIGWNFHISGFNQTAEQQTQAWKYEQVRIIKDMLMIGGPPIPGIVVTDEPVEWFEYEINNEYDTELLPYTYSQGRQAGEDIQESLADLRTKDQLGERYMPIYVKRLRRNVIVLQAKWQVKVPEGADLLSMFDLIAVIDRNNLYPTRLYRRFMLGALADEDNDEMELDAFSEETRQRADAAEQSLTRFFDQYAHLEGLDKARLIHKVSILEELLKG